MLVQRILEQIGKERAVRAMQAHLGRLADAVEIIDVKLRIGRHGNAMQARLGGYSLDMPRDDRYPARYPVELPFEGTLFGGGEIDMPVPFIEGLDGAPPKIIDHPRAGGQPPHDMAVVVVQIQMLEAVPSRRPDELRRSVKEGELIVELDPGVAGFGQHHAALAGIDIRKQEIQPALVAAFALDRQGLAVGQPVYPREIDILIGSQVDKRRGAAGEVEDPQAYAARWARRPWGSAARTWRRCRRRSRISG